MTILKSTTPEVLRRRAKTLDQDGYVHSFVLTLLRAADELEALQRIVLDDDQQMTVEAIADNRRLRHAILRAIATLKGPQGLTRAKVDVATKTLIDALRAVPPFGQGRAILAIQVGTEDAAADVIARSYEAILAHFAAKGAPSDAETSTT